MRDKIKSLMVLAGLMAVSSAIAGPAAAGPVGDVYLANGVYLDEFETLDGRSHAPGRYQLRLSSTDTPYGARAMVLNENGVPVGELPAQLYRAVPTPDGNSATFVELAYRNHSGTRRVSRAMVETLMVLGKDQTTVRIMLEGSAGQPSQ